MPLNHEHRRELISIGALLLGAFIALALLPTSLTGPLGNVLGQFLVRMFGVGIVIVPVVLLFIAAVGFRRIRGLDIGRVAILGAGLTLLIPFGIALLTGVRDANQLPADYETWTARHRIIGLIAAFLAVQTTGIIGTAGAVILGVFGLSALTVYTMGWHPFRALGLDAGESGVSVVGSTQNDETQLRLDLPPEDSEVDRPRKLPFGRRPKPRDNDEGVEQAFSSGKAIKPFPIDHLNLPKRANTAADEAALDRMGDVLVDTLRTFRVDAELGEHRSTGPVVTQFEVAPAAGVKVGRIAALADDLALKMEAKSIRIVAPIPGKSYVGVEVPNPTPRIVMLRELLSPPHWDSERTGLPIALGKDLEGKPVMADLTKMPHLLIAGATGSGKSVCINTIITSLIYRYTERELRMLMLDPKMVELTTYNALPHLIYPVVTNNRHAAKALKWAMYEMEDRYALFSVNNVRNLHEFNRKVIQGKPVVMPRPKQEDDGDASSPSAPAVVSYEGSTLPYVVIIVDELADLMMTVQTEVEKPLAILAQKARATGIHLVLATQRPSVNVITGLIKANFPSRIAFRVASKVDSRTILDQNGAESLLGNGDMLFLPPANSEPTRLQGAFIATEETDQVTGWYAEQTAVRGVESEDILAVVQEREVLEEGAAGEAKEATGERDALFREAAELCLQQQLGSTSLLQRKLRIGYGRAARVVDQLHEAGILGPPDGSKPREVLIGAHQLDEYCN